MSSAARTARAKEFRAETAAGLAQLAGKMAMERFESAHVAWKGDDSMVTDADIEIQAWLDEQIGEAFPEDGLLGEEGLPGGRRQLGRAPPLDSRPDRRHQ